MNQLQRIILKPGTFIATAALFAALSSTTSAKPDWAADVETKGDRDDLGCIVRASEDDTYLFDPTCDSHQVTKLDKNGNLKWVKYHDKGELQLGQVAPANTVRIPLLFGDCEGTEVITPSGNYSSNLFCDY